MADTIFFPILLAIITALVGGYITYRFTRRHEAEKHQYERSIETLDMLRTHASSVVGDFEAWMAKADSVGADSFNLPRTKYSGTKYSELPLATLSELPPLAQQGDKLIEKTLSMKG